MRGQDLAGQLAAADRVEGERGAGRDERLDQVVHERSARSSRRRTWRRVARSSSACSGLRTMFTSATPSFDAQLLQHLAEVRRRRGVHERRVAFAAHGLDHAERGQRIDEARGAFGRRRARRQHQALRRLAARGTARTSRRRACATVLPSSACAAGDEPAATTTPAPSLPTGSDWPTRAASARITSGAIVAVTTGLSAVPASFARARVGAAEQQPEVRRIDRRGLDAHEHLVGLRLRRRHARERELDQPFGLTVERSCRPVAADMVVVSSRGGGAGLGRRA